MLGIAFRMLSEWWDTHYTMSFKELLYTLLSPLQGTGGGMVWEVLGAVLPAAIVALVIYVAFAIAVRSKLGLSVLGLLTSIALLVNSGIYTWQAFGIGEYLKALEEKTTIYEDYYIDPDTVAITADGKPRNLIYIFLESMETTYASADDGGVQDGVNYMPNLTQMAKENVSFSNNEGGKIGGFMSPHGTTWTIAALLSILTGVPFSFPVEGSTMNTRVNFAKGITAFGDILEANGYRQVFLCGSDANFGGRTGFFTQHGSYEIYDLYTARKNGDVPPGYYDGWWGFEDMYLFEIAKRQITELAAGDQPFNFSMLTVDTHMVGGHECELCTDEYDVLTAKVVSCTDRQVQAFIEWCKQQDFYENTTIVMVGDHPRMDQYLVEDAGYFQRTMYNCILNSACQPEGETEGRTFTSMDMFPTVLAAMGFNIEGNKLGLGVNMFSGLPTLAEQLGYWEFNGELSKYSEYYVLNFS